MRNVKVKDLKPGMAMVGFQEEIGSGPMVPYEEHGPHIVKSVTDLGNGSYRVTVGGESQDGPGEHLILVK